MGSNDRRDRGDGADLLRAFRLGVRSVETVNPVSAKEVRFIAGVRPVDEKSLSFSRGPGSEKRTRFFCFLGVVVFGAVVVAT